MTISKQYTPGPWKCCVTVQSSYVDQGLKTVRPKYELGNAPIVTEDEAHANAQLISAAPEMAEALKFAVGNLGTHPKDETCKIGHCEICKWRDRGRLALTKAGIL